MPDFCEKCQVETISKFVHNEKGHIENQCSKCSMRRGISPYITKHKFDKMVSLNLITREGLPKGNNDENSKR